MCGLLTYVTVNSTRFACWLASPLRCGDCGCGHRRLYKGNKYKDGFLLKGVPFKSIDMEETAPNLNEMQVHTPCHAA